MFYAPQACFGREFEEQTENAHSGCIRLQYSMDKSKRRLTLVNLRERVKLSQQDLASRLGKRQATISAWENGGVPHLKPSEFRTMLDVLQCTVDDLVAAFEPDQSDSTTGQN